MASRAVGWPVRIRCKALPWGEPLSAVWPTVRADLSIEEFLAGVDVLPAHIAADLDLPRDAEVQALTHALSEQHSALLAGPSGAGKSALMWRTARELSEGTRS